MKVTPYPATASTQSHFPPPHQSPESSGDTPNHKIKSFFQIDQAAAFRLARELEPSDFKVFFFLTLRAYGWDDKARRVGDGTTRTSGSFVAKGTGLSETTSERYLAALKEKALITKHQHSCKWGNTYCVKPALLRQCPGDGLQPQNKKHQKTQEPPAPMPDLAQPKAIKPEPVKPEAEPVQAIPVCCPGSFDRSRT